MAEKVNRTVLVVSDDPRYRKYPFRSVPVFDESINTFITGQHIVPTDPETHGNLTLKQMRGEEPLTKEQAKKFGYVINPGNDNDYFAINIKDGKKFDISENADGTPFNPKDYWIHNYVANHVREVSKEKSSMIKGTHRFYLQDAIAEAAKRISKRSEVYKAVDKVRDGLSMEKLFNLAVMLNYFKKDFNVDPEKIQKDILEDMIYQVCEDEPSAIMQCFRPGWKDDLFILSLVQKRIIIRKGDDFFDGSVFIGKGLEGVKSFIAKSENQALLSKWSSYSKGHTTKDEDSLKVKAAELLNEGLMSLVLNNEEKANYYLTKLKEIGADAEYQKLANTISAKSEYSEEGEKNQMSEIHKLRLEAGRLKISKEEYKDLSEEELRNLIETKRAESKK